MDMGLGSRDHKRLEKTLPSFFLDGLTFVVDCLVIVLSKSTLPLSTSLALLAYKLPLILGHYTSIVSQDKFCSDTTWSYTSFYVFL
jgi:hypothetical protein